MPDPDLEIRGRWEVGGGGGLGRWRQFGLKIILKISIDSKVCQSCLSEGKRIKRLLW